MIGSKAQLRWWIVDALRDLVEVRPSSTSVAGYGITTAKP